MKRNFTLSLVLSCTLALFFIAGCQKGPITSDPFAPCQIKRVIIPSEVLVASNRVAPRKYTPKRIASLPVHTFSIVPGAADTIDFFYNQMGNPTRMTHKKDIGENALFRYDRSNRLSEYINIYPNGAGDYWHKFTYDQVRADRIIADTAFRDFFSSNGQLVDYNDIDLTTFKYDSIGRIIQTKEYVLGDTIVRNFAYDSKGDLQYPGALYDNHPNVHLTNKIWMFIDRLYSINNPVDQESYTYNSSGYPKTISNSSAVAPGLVFIQIGYPFAIIKARFDYSCSVD